MIVLHDVESAIPVVKAAQRILVIGCSGSGKSTLSQYLARRMDRLYVSCDRDIFWLPGWKIRPRAEVDERMQFFVSMDRWIIDGNSPRTLPIRLSRTDMIIWLRPSRSVCLWGVISRWIRFRGQTRPEMAEGCPEKIDAKFLRYIWNFEKTEVPEIMGHVNAARADIPVLEMKTRQQGERLLALLDA